MSTTSTTSTMSTETNSNPFKCATWKSKAVSPSRLTRFIAGKQEYGDIQYQESYGSGVTEFSMSGHGCIVALVGIADLDPVWVDAARKKGIAQKMLVTKVFGKTRIFGPVHYYAAGDVEDYTRSVLGVGGEVAEVEALVGEEDIAWTLVVSALGPKHLNKWQAERPGFDMAKISSLIKHWYPEIWEEVKAI